MKILLLFFLLLCVSAQDYDNNNVGSQSGGFLGGLLSLPLYFVQQGFTTTRNAIELGTETGRRFLDFGISQLNQWTDVAKNSLGRVTNSTSNRTRFPSLSSLIPNRNNGFQRTTTQLPVINSNSMTEESILKQISNLQKDLDSTSGDQTWFREVKVQRIKELQNQLQSLRDSINSQTNNNNFQTRPARIPVYVDSSDSVPTKPPKPRPIPSINRNTVSRRPTSTTTSNTKNPSQDDSIIPIIS